MLDVLYAVLVDQITRETGSGQVAFDGMRLSWKRQVKRDRYRTLFSRDKLLYGQTKQNLLNVQYWGQRCKGG